MVDFYKLFDQIKKKEFQFIKNKFKNKLYHYYIPPFKVSSDLPSIFLFSSTRSGSTWVFELLLKTEKYRAIFEPLPKLENCMRNFGTPRIVLSKESQFDSSYSFLGQLTNYNRAKWKEYYYNSKNIHLFTRGALIKSTRANFCIDFIEKETKEKLNIIYLVRSPFDVVKSKISRKNADNGKMNSKFNYNPLELFNTEDPVFTKYFKRYKFIADSINNEVQKETFVWCLENKWLFEECKSRNWYVLVYENLLTDFDNEYEKLCEFIGIKTNDKVKKQKSIKSSTAFTGNKRDFIDSSEFKDLSIFLQNWRKFYTNDQILDIEEILSLFEIDYSNYLSGLSKKFSMYPDNV